MTIKATDQAGADEVDEAKAAGVGPWEDALRAGARPVTVLVGARGDLAAFVLGVLMEERLVDRVVPPPERDRHPAGHIREIEEILIVHRVLGHRVALHTHSPYVLDHLVTLAAAHALTGAARARVVARLARRDERALLDPRDLAVYQVHEDADARYGVRVVPIYDAARVSVDLRVFSDVGDEATNLYSDVLAALRDLDEPRSAS